MDLFSFCAFLNIYAICLLVQFFCLLLQLFPSLRVFNIFIDFFYIFTRLCHSWMSAVFQPQTCNVFVASLIKLRPVIFRLSPGVPFGWASRAAVSHRMRPCARPLGAILPAARLVSIRDTSVRMFRTVQRLARGYSTTSVEKQSTPPRETLLDCAVRSSHWTFSTLRRPRVGV